MVIRFYVTKRNLPAESSSVHDAEVVEDTADDKKGENAAEAEKAGAAEDATKAAPPNEDDKKSEYQGFARFTPPPRKLTFKTVIGLLKGELMALPMLIAMIATLYLLSRSPHLFSSQS